jgi:hypothetical protein
LSAAVATRVDWFRILDDLKREGYGLREIAHFTAIPRSNLFSYRTGSEPNYSNGARLIAFWSNATGRAIDTLPHVDPYSHRA